MGIREWTASAIEQGGALKWFGGMVVKLGAEALLASLMGYALMRVLWWWLDIEVFQIFLGGATREVVWAGVTLGLFKVVHCRFTEPLVTD